MGKLPSKVLLFIVGLAFAGFIVSFPETFEGFEVGGGLQVHMYRNPLTPEEEDE